MSLVRLLGFRTLTCGCVIGRYRDLASGRELTYVEEKGRHLRVARAPPQPHGDGRAVRTSRRFPCSKPARRSRAADRSPTHRATIAGGASFAPSPHHAHVRLRTLRFYLGDCTELLPRSRPAASTRSSRRRRITWASVTGRTTTPSPDRSISQWTDRWLAAAAGALSPQGSLFLNVGAKPTDPGRRSTWRRRRASTSACRTRFTGSSRSRSKRRWPGRARVSPTISRWVTTSPSTAGASSTTAMSSCSTSHRAATRRSTATPSA